MSNEISPSTPAPPPPPPRREVDDVDAVKAKPNAGGRAAPRALDKDEVDAPAAGGRRAQQQAAPHLPAVRPGADTARVYADPKPAAVKPADNERDQRMQRAGVPEAQRKRINDHLASLDDKDRAKEQATLDHALASKNAARAVATYDSLAKLSKESPQAKERLSPDVRDSLVRGVADSRTAESTGQKGVLGKAQAEQAARALTSMPAAQVERVKGALDGVGKGSGADPQAERALIMKAVGARATDMKDPKKAEKATDDVVKFASDIRGMERGELIKSTTPLGINGENGPDTDHLSAGDHTTGVGHYQRFEDSCGPTTAQNLKAERDPVYAMKMRKEGTGGGVDSELAKEQKATLERPRFYDKHWNEVKATPEQEAKFKKDGTLPPRATQVQHGVAISRLGNQSEGRLRVRLDSPEGRKALSADERKSVKRMMENKALTAEQQKHADAGLQKLREKDGGFPSTEEMKAIQSNFTRHKDGTSSRKAGDGMALEPALDDIAGHAPGKSWQTQETNGGKGAMNDKDLKGTDKKLEEGTEVPIRIANLKNNEEGHFMMMSDVRGKSPDRQYLVSDPWSGKTAWVPERELKSPTSKWPQKHFGLGPNTGVTSTYAEG